MMFENKTVIITAGNRGDGLALSKKYADNGVSSLPLTLTG